MSEPSSPTPVRSAAGAAGRAGQIAHLLGQVGCSAQAAFAERVADLGLGTQHTLVLRAVGVGPGRSQNDIARATGLSPSRLVALVDELEDMDAVRRRRAPGDRRRHAIVLTDTGKELIRGIARAAAEHGRILLADLDPAERETLHGLLTRLHVDSGPPGGLGTGTRDDHKERAADHAPPAF